MKRRNFLVTIAIVLGGCGSDAGPGGGGDLAAGGGGDLGVCDTCLQHGTFRMNNLSPCFAESPLTDGGTLVGATSSLLMNGQAQCPLDPTMKPVEPWSTDSITTDCAGHFVFCVALKAGDPSAPKPSDCVMAQSCTTGDYAAAGLAQSFPALPSWISPPGQMACVISFRDSGGYSEATASGTATGCGTLTRLLWRIRYVPIRCGIDPHAAGCPQIPDAGDGPNPWTE